MSDFPKLYTETSKAHVRYASHFLDLLAAAAAYLIILNRITTTLLQLMACFHATTLIVLSFTNGAKNGSCILIG